jgi:hypothetical protein
MGHPFKHALETDIRRFDVAVGVSGPVLSSKQG